MGISGCTSCQAGGVEALKAYDQTIQLQRDVKAANDARALGSQSVTPFRQSELENQPIAGAVLGSVINISA